MELATALDYARSHPDAVLVTLKADGRPQSSNVRQWTDDDGVLRVSLTDSRAKTRNLRRDARATLYVPGDSFWSYLVLDGTADLSPVAQAPDDPTVEELVDLYRSISGEHPDWAEYRSVMADERRLVVRLRVERAYGIPPS